MMEKCCILSARMRMRLRRTKVRRRSRKPFCGYPVSCQANDRLQSHMIESVADYMRKEPCPMKPVFVTLGQITGRNPQRKGMCISAACTCIFARNNGIIRDRMALMI